MPRGNQGNSVRFNWGEQSIEKGAINVLNRVLHLEGNATPLTPYMLQNARSINLFTFTIAHRN